MRPSPTAVGLRGLCPRCGAKTLFAGPLAFAVACTACALDFSSFNVGDGPAAFVTAIGGAVVVIGAVTLELAVSPPFWVHAAVWIPVTLLLVLGGLRVAKGWLIAREFRQNAREGRSGSARP